MLKTAATFVCAVSVLILPAAQQRGSWTPRRDLLGKQFDARVVRVADGDTLEAIPVGEQRPIRIRLHGVDAPELGETFSSEAMAVLRTLVFDQRVRVDGRDIDRYNRLVARVVLGAKDASTELLRLGLACHAFARDAALANEEALARSAGRGFWSATAKKPACVARQSTLAAGRSGSSRAVGGTKRIAAGYRGNVSSGIYHASWCPNARCRNCTRLFSTEAEAKNAGFRPAADCAR